MVERTHDEKNSQNNRPRTLCEDLCADGTFKRCILNPMSMCVKQRVSSPPNGESTVALESYFDEHGKEVWGHKLDES